MDQEEIMNAVDAAGAKLSLENWLALLQAMKADIEARIEGAEADQRLQGDE